MARFSILSSSALVSLALLGCDPQPAPTDAGRDAPVIDSAEGPDAPLDAPGADTSDEDAPSTCLCEADETCVRGVCLATCDGLEGIEDALVPGVLPVSHACRSAGALDAVGDDVYELTTEADGEETVLRLVRWTFANGDVTPTTIAQTTVAYPVADVFPGYVAVSADEAHALFGYTTNTPPDYLGGVVDISVGDMTLQTVEAPGNFDATFAMGPMYLVNGIAFDELEGQALYAASATEGDPAGTAVVTGMGDASGSVAVWEEEGLVVFGGARYGSPWPDESTGGYVFFLDGASLGGPSGPIDAFEEAQRLVLPGAFELLTRGRLVETYYGAVGVDGIRYYQLNNSDEGVESSDALGITTGGTFFSAAAIGDDVLLIHGTGTLRVTVP